MLEQKKMNFKMILTKGVEIGLIIFAVGSPFSISLAQIGFISALIFWIIKLIFIKDEKLKGTYIDMFLLLFFIGCILSSILSIDPVKSLNGNKKLWLISMIYLLFNNADLNFIKKLLKILLISSVLMGIYGIFQSLTGIDLWRNNVGKYGPFLYGAVGGFGLHLTYGGYQMMTALILLSILMFGMEDFKKKTKILIVISTIVVSLSVIASFARTAWIGFIAGFLILGIYGFFTKSKKIIFIIAGTFIVMIILFLSFDAIRIRFLRIISDLNQSARIELWGGALEMIKDHPIFGVGRKMFKRYFLKYRPDYIGAYGNPHNDFLTIYLRAGIIGFIGYILVFFMYFKKMIRLAFYVYKSNKFIFSVILGCIISVIAFLIAGLGQNYFTDSENAMLLWFVFGISMVLYYKSGYKEINKSIKK